MSWFRKLLGMERGGHQPPKSESPPENGARYRIHPAHGEFGGDNIRWCVQHWDDGKWRLMSWHESYDECESDRVRL